MEICFRIIIVLEFVLDIILCELTFLLVLSFAQKGFSPGNLVFPSLYKPTCPISNLIWEVPPLVRDTT